MEMAISSDKRGGAAEADRGAIVVGFLAIGWHERLTERPCPGRFIESVKIGSSGAGSPHGRPARTDEQLVLPLGDRGTKCSVGATRQALHELPIVSGVFVD